MIGGRLWCFSDCDVSFLYVEGGDGGWVLRLGWMDGLDDGSRHGWKHGGDWTRYPKRGGIWDFSDCAHVVFSSSTLPYLCMSSRSHDMI